ncbi:MAG: DUF3833 domain-containing protein [Alphaproteobacteria bacterium]|nr:DUF3833 domain-containing protein [Alphaproteobacteria bacterium]
MLSSCSSTPVETYAGQTPTMAFDQFFNGPLVGHAIVQNRSGKVIRRFTVDMVGTWNGDQGTLEEHFVYNDGKTQDRTWHIRKHADGTFTGTAADIVGVAHGKAAGNAIKWQYVMKVEVNGRLININFDDWMFMATDNIIINRSIMKKFGFNVGEITITIHKK